MIARFIRWYFRRLADKYDRYLGGNDDIGPPGPDQQEDAR